MLLLGQKQINVIVGDLYLDSNFVEIRQFFMFHTVYYFLVPLSVVIEFKDIIIISVLFPLISLSARYLRSICN
jgi:hypothetical protein